MLAPGRSPPGGVCSHRSNRRLQVPRPSARLSFLSTPAQLDELPVVPGRRGDRMIGPILGRSTCHLNPPGLYPGTYLSFQLSGRVCSKSPPCCRTRQHDRSGTAQVLPLCYPRPPFISVVHVIPHSSFFSSVVLAPCAARAFIGPLGRFL